MCVRVFALVMVQCAIGGALCQTPVLLHDGQQLTLKGVLTPQPAGRLQFVVVRTTQFYVPVMHYDGADHRGEPTRDIALSDYHDYAQLYAHRGETVTVTGVVSTDPASPYYLQNMRLGIRSIRGTHGENLLRTSSAAARVAVDTGTYRASALLPADPAAPWQYRVQGGSGNGDALLSCSSNGGGDVVNCYCADGFRPTEAVMLKAGNQSKGDLFPDGSLAQFGVGEDTAEVHLSVTCSR